MFEWLVDPEAWISLLTLAALVDTHPTLKILALAFLILVGVSLMAESLDIHIPKGYIYFAMGFSTVVEMLNIKMRKSLGH